MRNEVIMFTVQHSRIAILLLIVVLVLLIGGVGEVAAHGPCHENPGAVPEFVCEDLPSSEAPRGS